MRATLPSSAPRPSGLDKARGARSYTRGELTGGDGTHRALECVGTRQAIEMSLGVVRDGGVVRRVDAAQHDGLPLYFGTFVRNVTLTGGVAPRPRGVRAG